MQERSKKMTMQNTKDPNQPIYKQAGKGQQMHITITGRLGSGKSTVCRIFSDKYGYEIYSTGTIHRRIAAEKGISALEMNELMATDLSFDHMIDDAVSRISRENRDRTLIFDSRMAWHFACDSFRVFMHIDPAIAARRVIADDRGEVEKYTDIDDARRQLLARAMSENTRYKRIYGVDNLDYRNFDLIVDSATISPEALAELILAEFKRYAADPATYSHPRLLLSPQAIYPTADTDAMSKDDSELTIMTRDGSHYAIGGGRKLLRGLEAGEQIIEAKLADTAAAMDQNMAAEALGARGGEIMRRLEDRYGFTYPEIPAIYR